VINESFERWGSSQTLFPFWGRQTARCVEDQRFSKGALGFERLRFGLPSDRIWQWLKFKVLISFDFYINVGKTLKQCYKPPLWQW
jgi:hypothetical protein